MKLKQLESLLQDVEPFREPDQMLEQYPTGAHLASRVVAEAHAHGDIEGRAVVDLGVGGGVLTIASLLMGAAKVTGLDLDPNALDLTRENCAAFDPPLEPALALARIPRDVARLRRRVTREEIRSVDARDARERHDTTSCRRSEDERTDTDEDSNRDSPTSSFLALRADTVIMNPPFGTRRRGADLGFLRAGLMLARNAVYSLNKTSTRAHVERHATRALRASSATVLAELRYELPKTYAHHRRESVEIEVDLWRFEPPRDGRVGRGKRESENPSSDDASETESESRASESESDSDAGEPSGALEKEEKFPELKYAGARGAFCDRRDFEPRRAGRSGGKGARDSRAVIAGGRESAGRGRGGGRSGGGGRGRGRR
jgi:putative methylase